MKTTPPGRSSRMAAMAAAALLLGGSASFSRDGGLDAVSALTQERTGQPVRFGGAGDKSEAARTETENLLRQPLGPDEAVRIALLNNRGLRASLANLGVADA